MQLHEYQARSLLEAEGVRVPRAAVARRPEEVEAALAGVSLPVVIKAQVHAGGRGKAGAIRVARSRAEAHEHARAILGMELRTAQTGDAGLVVRTIMLAEAIDIRAELYVALLTDRETRRTVLMVSRAGGVDIEETASREPGAILRLSVDPLRGLADHQCRDAHFFLFPDGGVAVGETARLLRGLYRVYRNQDATMVEVNPVAVNAAGELVAVDAKVALDDNARFRHADWDAFVDPAEQEPRELEASQYGLNYIKVGQGSIGCMVNGAGLAMATMDVIHLYGARPANFLDVGGGATVENVTVAFRILAGDPDVKAILVNIFGGIMKCDVIAEGILKALQTVKLCVPLVVRLEGTNVELGRKLLQESGLPCQTAGDLSEAAQLAVAAAGGG